MGIVLFTVFVFGCTTDLVLNWLGIETYVDEEKYMQDNGTEQKVDFFLRFGKCQSTHVYKRLDTL
jgi:hypothetical protein